MKIQLKNGLKLSKETLSKLQESQMAQVTGGKLFSSSGAACTCRDNSCRPKIEAVE